MKVALSFGIDPDTRDKMVLLELTEGKVQSRLKFSIQDATAIGTMLLEAAAKLGPQVKLATADQMPTKGES